MKQLILFCLSVAVVSCGSVKKIQKRQTALTDSSTTVSIISNEVIKKDSTGKEQTVSTTKTVSEDGYSKTTTIKEYFSNDSVDLSKGDKSGKVLYRETEIKETGAGKKTGESIIIIDTKSTVSTIDSSARQGESKVEVKKTQVSVDGKKVRETIVPVWMLTFFAFLVILFIGYRIFKNKIDFNPFD